MNYTRVGMHNKSSLHFFQYVCVCLCGSACPMKRILLLYFIGVAYFVWYGPQYRVSSLQH